MRLFRFEDYVLNEAKKAKEEKEEKRRDPRAEAIAARLKIKQHMDKLGLEVEEEKPKKKKKKAKKK